MTTEKLPEKIAAHLRRSLEMQRLTEDHAVQTFWRFWDERTPGRVDFTIQANISWESAAKLEVAVGPGWIRPTPYDPPGGGPKFEIPITVRSEFGAGIAVEDTLSDEDASKALIVLGRAADDASFLTSAPTGLI